MGAEARKMLSKHACVTRGAAHSWSDAPSAVEQICLNR